MIQKTSVTLALRTGIKDWNFETLASEYIFRSYSKFNKQLNFVSMNFRLIIAMLIASFSATRLGFHGSIYQYADFGYLSPNEVAAIKEIIKQRCIAIYGPRFC